VTRALALAAILTAASVSAVAAGDMENCLLASARKVPVVQGLSIERSSVEPFTSNRYTVTIVAKLGSHMLNYGFACHISQGVAIAYPIPENPE
jgi:hypothetical protein